jgi:DNA-binding response OmpR family regulator
MTLHEPQMVIAAGGDGRSGALTEALMARGMAVSIATGDLDLTSLRPVDAMVVDIDGMGPDAALADIGKLRSSSAAVVIVVGSDLPSHRRVQFLVAGADDVVPKPFSADELVLRVRAIVRRMRASRSARVVVVGSLQLDAGTHTAHCGAGTVEVRPREFALLRYLADHAGQLVTREQIMAEVWGQPRGNSATVTVHVGRLRQHLRRLGCEDVALVTVHGKGYRLEVG